MVAGGARAAALDEAAAALDAGATLPTWLYTDPAAFALERERIFRTAWGYVGRREQLSKHGSYVAGYAGTVPVVVVNDGGELRAFVNVCRHRLHPVVEGCGVASSLQCPYHGWQYDLSGRLRAAPRARFETGFDKAGISLVPAAVECWGPFVFVNADEHAVAFAETYQDILADAEAKGFDLADYQFADQVVYDVPVNWKLWMENALECYHCPLVHKTTFATAFHTTGDSYVAREFDLGVSHESPVRSAPSELGEAPGRPGFLLYFLWPLIGMSTDGWLGTMGRPLPLEVNRTRFIVDLYSRRELDQEQLAAWAEMYDETFKEDERVVLAQRAGYDAGVVPSGLLMQASELSLRVFAERTLGALTET
jgi:phenylpropionate dioxygenase-like ring-hydroxylating dioxygenase large terminal subunit